MSEQPNVIGANIRIIHNNGSPEIRLSKSSNNPETIKDIIDAAFSNKPILVVPEFRDKIQAIGKLTEKGIITYNTDSKCYEYTI